MILLTFTACHGRAIQDAIPDSRKQDRSYDLYIPQMYIGNADKLLDPDAISEEQLRNVLGLYQTTGKGKINLEGIRPIEVFMCSVVLRQGYGDGKYFENLNSPFSNLSLSKSWAYGLAVYRMDICHMTMRLRKLGD
jgi:hypothetical protein